MPFRPGRFGKPSYMGTYDGVLGRMHFTTRHSYLAVLITLRTLLDDETSHDGEVRHQQARRAVLATYGQLPAPDGFQRGADIIHIHTRRPR